MKGFPTIKWFDGKSDKPEDYNGGRDLDSLSKFITERTGVMPKSRQTPPSSVQVLTDRSFAQAIGAEKNVLVAFTGEPFPLDFTFSLYG